MPLLPRATTRAAALVFALGLAFASSACSAPTAETASTPTPTPSQASEGQPDEPSGGGDQDEATDGGTDPGQDLVRTGPVAQYGGPAYGDQGDAELIEPGAWCKTIVVFWGGTEPIPDGVRFTFESAVADQPGLAVEAGTCGSAGADRTCLGLTVAANEDGVFCSIVVRPSADFVEGTTVSFTGSLECPTSEICDAVAARSVDPGPPLVVTTPAGS